MSTLEKFGILVILILVVIIGVVAVWGVRPDEANPFDKVGEGTAVASGDAAATDPAGQAAAWPDGGAAPAAGAPAAPVAPPALGETPSSATAGSPPPAAPVARGGSTYRVKKGDTLEKIAKETLGDGTRWKEIEKANPGLNARRLKIDMEIQIPGGGGTSVASAAPAPMSVPAPNTFTAGNTADGPSEPAVPAASASTREVTVQSGDTLYAIARRELGNENFYYKIQKANPGVDPRKLKPGMKIKVPVE